jgi:hypothetical protein
MKINIHIEADSPAEAVDILSALSGGTPAKPVAVKKPATKKAKKVEPEPTPEPEPVVEAPVEVMQTEESVTTVAKALVAASSSATLRAVLDVVIGAGVKISGAPKDKYNELFDAISAKTAEIESV